MSTPLLKFFEELVNNKSSRIVFDNVSPNGIILFKEASRVLLAYGNRLLAAPMPPVGILVGYALIEHCMRPVRVPVIFAIASVKLRGGGYTVFGYCYNSTREKD